MDQVEGHKVGTPTPSNSAVEKGMTTAEAVEQLLRKDKVKLSNEKEVEVRLCRVRDIPTFTKFMEMLFVEMQDGLTQGETIEEAIKAKIHDLGFFLKLISKNFGEAVKIVTQFSSISADEFEELEIDDATAILVRLVEVNFDFFMLRVAPMVKEAIARSTQRRIRIHKPLQEKT